MPSRRSVLVGLGGLVAGGGALIGTGAFTTVEAERTVNVETTGDASGFLGLEAADRLDDSSTNFSDNSTTGANQNDYVQETSGTIVINLDGSATDGDADDSASGLNQNAKTTFLKLVKVTNNGTQDINELNLKLDATSVGSFTNTNVEGVFSFTVGNSTGSTVANPTGTSPAANLLGTGSVSSTLSPGSSFVFGIKIDLLNNSISELPSGASYTLTIEALTTNSNS
jgi:hypothetical protein